MTFMFAFKRVEWVLPMAIIKTFKDLKYNYGKEEEV